MSETLEERIRRHAIESRDDLIGFYASDIAELLDERDEKCVALERAVRALLVKMRNIHNRDYWQREMDALASLLEQETK